MTLDDMFGPPVPPRPFGPESKGYRDWEKCNRPMSLSRLTAETAISLKTIMDDVGTGWMIGRVLTNDILIIWIVDLSGIIWFAVEECVIDGQHYSVPKHQTLPLTSGAEKLGHPSLVDCGNARIAGEIRYDPDPSVASWVINNKSGRYGTHPSRTCAQLVRVAAEFGRHRISLKHRFLGQR